MLSQAVNRSTLPSRATYPRRVVRGKQLVVVNAVSDASIRVRGDIKKVFKYLGDFRNHADFDKTIVESYKMGAIDGRVQLGTRFQTVHSPFPGINIPVTYEVVEYVPHKRIALAGDSENFTSTKTLALMTHPAQKEFTVVRQLVDIKMKNWKSIIPMLDVQLAKREEAGASELEKLLNSSSSPLNKLRMDAEDLRSAPRGGTSTSSGSFSSWDQDEQAERWKELGSMATNMLGNLFNRNGNSATQEQQQYSNGANQAQGSSYSNGQSWANGASSNGRSQYAGSSNGYSYSSSSASTVVIADPLGYYQVLGLDTSKSVTEDDIKSAFRAAAQQLHPDKMASADDRAKQAAKIQFQILQAAYSTLKDPVKRNMYDRGQLSVSSDL